MPETNAILSLSGEDRGILSLLEKSSNAVGQFTANIEDSTSSLGDFSNQGNVLSKALGAIGRTGSSAGDAFGKLSDSYRDGVDAAQNAIKVNKVMDNSFVGLAAKASGFGKQFGLVQGVLGPVAGGFEEIAEAEGPVVKGFTALNMIAKPLSGGLKLAAGFAQNLAEQLRPLGTEGEAIAGVLDKVAGGLSKASGLVNIADKVGDVYRLFNSVKEFATEGLPALFEQMKAVGGMLESVGIKQALWGTNMAKATTIARVLSATTQGTTKQLSGMFLKMVELKAGVDQFAALGTAAYDTYMRMTGVNEAFEALQGLGVDTTMAELAVQIGVVGEGLLTNAEAAKKFVQVSVTQFAQVQDSLQALQTLSSARAEGSEKLMGSLKGLTQDLGNVIDLTQAAGAAYNAFSSGQDTAAKAAQALNASTKLATVLGTDQAETYGTLNQVLGSTATNARNAGDMAARINALMEKGVFSGPQLTGFLSELTSAAQTAGVAVDDAWGSIAKLSETGAASQRATQLQNLFYSFVSQSDGAAKALKDLGIRVDQQTIKTKGLFNVVDEIYKATGGSAAKIREIFPDTEAYQGFLAVATTARKGAEENANFIKSATTESLDEVFDTRRQSLIQQATALSNGFKNVMADLGQRVLPLLEPGIKFLNGLLERFQAMPEPMKNMIAASALIAIGLQKATSIGNIWIGSLGGILKSYLMARAGSLLFSGQLVSEGKAIADLIKNQKDYAGAFFRILGIQEKFISSTQQVGQEVAAAAAKETAATKASEAAQKLREKASNAAIEATKAQEKATIANAKAVELEAQANKAAAAANQAKGRAEAAGGTDTRLNLDAFEAADLETQTAAKAAKARAEAGKLAEDATKKQTAATQARTAAESAQAQATVAKNQAIAASEGLVAKATEDSQFRATKAEAARADALKANNDAIALRAKAEQVAAEQGKEATEAIAARVTAEKAEAEAVKLSNAAQKAKEAQTQAAANAQQAQAVATKLSTQSQQAEAAATEASTTATIANTQAKSANAAADVADDAQVASVQAKTGAIAQNTQATQVNTQVKGQNAAVAMSDDANVVTIDAETGAIVENTSAATANTQAKAQNTATSQTGSDAVTIDGETAAINENTTATSANAQAKTRAVSQNAIDDAGVVTIDAETGAIVENTSATAANTQAKTQNATVSTADDAAVTLDAETGAVVQNTSATNANTQAKTQNATASATDDANVASVKAETAAVVENTTATTANASAKAQTATAGLVDDANVVTIDAETGAILQNTSATTANAQAKAQNAASGAVDNAEVVTIEAETVAVAQNTAATQANTQAKAQNAATGMADGADAVALTAENAALGVNTAGLQANNVTQAQHAAATAADTVAIGANTAVTSADTIAEGLNTDATQANVIAQQERMVAVKAQGGIMGAIAKINSFLTSEIKFNTIATTANAAAQKLWSAGAKGLKGDLSGFTGLFKNAGGGAGQAGGAFNGFFNIVKGGFGAIGTAVKGFLTAFGPIIVAAGLAAGAFMVFKDIASMVGLVGSESDALADKYAKVANRTEEIDKKHKSWLGQSLEFLGLVSKKSEQYSGVMNTKVLPALNAISNLGAGLIRAPAELLGIDTSGIKENIDNAFTEIKDRIQYMKDEKLIAAFQSLNDDIGKQIDATTSKLGTLKVGGLLNEQSEQIAAAYKGRAIAAADFNKIQEAETAIVQQTTKANDERIQQLQELAKEEKNPERKQALETNIELLKNQSSKLEEASKKAAKYREELNTLASVGEQNNAAMGREQIFGTGTQEDVARIKEEIKSAQQEASNLATTSGQAIAAQTNQLAELEKQAGEKLGINYADRKKELAEAQASLAEMQKTGDTASPEFGARQQKVATLKKELESELSELDAGQKTAIVNANDTLNQVQSKYGDAIAESNDRVATLKQNLSDAQGLFGRTQEELLTKAPEYAKENVNQTLGIIEEGLNTTNSFQRRLGSQLITATKAELDNYANVLSKDSFENLESLRNDHDNFVEKASNAYEGGAIKVADAVKLIKQARDQVVQLPSGQKVSALNPQQVQEDTEKIIKLLQQEGEERAAINEHAIDRIKSAEEGLQITAAQSARARLAEELKAADIRIEAQRSVLEETAGFYGKDSQQYVEQARKVESMERQQQNRRLQLELAQVEDAANRRVAIRESEIKKIATLQATMRLTDGQAQIKTLEQETANANERIKLEENRLGKIADKNSDAYKDQERKVQEARQDAQVKGFQTEQARLDYQTQQRVAIREQEITKIRALEATLGATAGQAQIKTLEQEAGIASERVARIQQDLSKITDKNSDIYKQKARELEAAQLDVTTKRFQAEAAREDDAMNKRIAIREQALARIRAMEATLQMTGGQAQVQSLEQEAGIASERVARIQQDLAKITDKNSDIYKQKARELEAAQLDVTTKRFQAEAAREDDAMNRRIAIREQALKRIQALEATLQLTAGQAQVQSLEQEASIATERANRIQQDLAKIQDKNSEIYKQKSRELEAAQLDITTKRFQAQQAQEDYYTDRRVKVNEDAIDRIKLQEASLQLSSYEAGQATLQQEIQISQERIDRARKTLEQIRATAGENSDSFIDQAREVAKLEREQQTKVIQMQTNEALQNLEQRSKGITNAVEEQTQSYKQQINAIELTSNALDQQQKITESRNRLIQQSSDFIEGQFANVSKLVDNEQLRANIEAASAETRVRNLEITQAAERASAANQERLTDLSLKRQVIENNIAQLENQRAVAQAQIELERAKVQGKLTDAEEKELRLRISGLEQEGQMLSAQGGAIQQNIQQQSEMNANARIELDMRQQVAKDGGIIDALIAKQQKLNAQINQQKDLLEKQKELMQSRSDYVLGELDLAQQAATNEKDRERIARISGDIKLKALQQQQVMESRLLELNLAQQAATLEQEKARVRMQKAQAQADIQQAKSKVQEAIAGGASGEQVNALVGAFQAQLEKAAALEGADQLLAQQGKIQEQQAAAQREQMQLSQGLALDRARLDKIQTQPEGAGRDAALQQFSRSALAKSQAYAVNPNVPVVAPPPAVDYEKIRADYLSQLKEFVVPSMQATQEGIAQSDRDIQASLNQKISSLQPPTPAAPPRIATASPVPQPGVTAAIVPTPDKAAIDVLSKELKQQNKTLEQSQKSKGGMNVSNTFNINLAPGQEKQAANNVKSVFLDMLDEVIAETERQF